jgi:Squalene-hopene cyclase C-terminal domain
MASDRTENAWVAHLRRRWFRLLQAEYDRDTLRSVPSWGLSLLLHAFVLLLLAFFIRIRLVNDAPRSIHPAVIDTQLGDLTSLVEADRAGDPFTREDSPDPPSLGLTSTEPELRLVGQPEIPALSQFAPSLAGPSSLSNPNVSGPSLGASIILPELSTNLTAPFSGRQGLTRARLVRREGGTAKSEKSVEDGLAWIVRHQRPDGSWSLNYSTQCQGSGCPHGTAVESDTAATGLALLPLLGAGYIHTVKCRHQEAVRRGLEWLVAHQNAEGDLFVGPPAFNTYLYSHAIAAMAVCEGFGLSGDNKLKQPAQRAIKFIINAQDPVGGGWRYTPGMAGDTSVFGWQIFALRSANLAGIKLPKNVLKGCSRYLDQAAVDRSRTMYSYMPGRGGAKPAMTAEALVARQLLGWPRDFPPLVKGAAQIAAHLETMDERNIYYWYYATQLLHNMKNKDWERWNPKVRESLIEMQVKDESCAHGSWDPDRPVQDAWGTSGGRLYVTSLSILTLEVYYRYLPMYRGYDEDQKAPGQTLKADDDDEPKPKPATTSKTRRR